MPRTRRRFGPLAPWWLCAGLLAAVAAAVPAAAQTKVRLTHSTEDFSFLVPLAASASGAFKEAGLDAEVVRTGSGAKAMAAAISGDADICFTSPTSVVQARGNGADLVLFSATVTQVNSNIVVSKEWAARHGVTQDSPFERKLAALKGIRVGVSGVGSGSDYIVRYLGRLAGLEPDRDMTIIGLGADVPAVMAALENGRVDGNSVAAPTSHLEVSGLGGTLLFNTAAGEVKSLDGLFYIGAAANRTWLERNRDTARKVASALQKTLDALADPARTTAVRDRVHAAYYATIDKAVFDGIWADQSKAFPKSGRITKDMMTFLVDVSDKYIGARLDPALVDKAYATEYADAAEPR